MEQPEARGHAGLGGEGFDAGLLRRRAADADCFGPNAPRGGAAPSALWGCCGNFLAFFAVDHFSVVPYLWSTV
jgi:hypothetical protein